MSQDQYLSLKPTTRGTGAIVGTEGQSDNSTDSHQTGQFSSMGCWHQAISILEMSVLSYGGLHLILFMEKK